MLKIVCIASESKVCLEQIVVVLSYISSYHGNRVVLCVVKSRNWCGEEWNLLNIEYLYHL